MHYYSLATVRGHIHREQKNLQSTKKPTIKNNCGVGILSKSDIKYMNVAEAVHNEDKYFPASPSPNKN